VEGGTLVATVHENQASGSTTSLASSDGLVVLPPGDASIAAGAAIEFLRWSDV
jgi:molybdopterin biosynthesis enzyme